MVKIVFMGPANSGKTSIKRRFFKDEEAIDILSQPSKPTYWEEENFEHVDFFLRVLDLGGQESYVDEWHGRMEEMVFASTDAIVYVVDASERKMALKARTYLERVLYSAIRYLGTASNLKLYILLHKADLLDCDVRRRRVTSHLKRELTNVVEMQGEPKMLRGIYETSVCDGSSNKAMRVILNDVMPAYEKYRALFQKVIAEGTPTVIERIQLVTPEKGLIVAEAMKSLDETTPTCHASAESAGIRKLDLTPLITGINKAARDIDESGLEYILMRMRSGRHVVMRSLGDYLLLVESRKGVGEDKFIKTLDYVVRMFKDAEKLLGARRVEKNRSLEEEYEPFQTT